MARNGEDGGKTACAHLAKRNTRRKEKREKTNQIKCFGEVAVVGTTAFRERLSMTAPRCDRQARNVLIGTHYVRNRSMRLRGGCNIRPLNGLSDEIVSKKRRTKRSRSLQKGAVPSKSTSAAAAHMLGRRGSDEIVLAEA